jgi:hypothetical protein
LYVDGSLFCAPHENAFSIAELVRFAALDLSDGWEFMMICGPGYRNIRVILRPASGLRLRPAGRGSGTGRDRLDDVEIGCRRRSNYGHIRRPIDCHNVCDSRSAIFRGFVP